MLLGKNFATGALNLPPGSRFALVLGNLTNWSLCKLTVYNKIKINQLNIYRKKHIKLIQRHKAHVRCVSCRSSIQFRWVHLLGSYSVIIITLLLSVAQLWENLISFQWKGKTVSVLLGKYIDYLYRSPECQSERMKQHGWNSIKLGGNQINTIVFFFLNNSDFHSISRNATEAFNTVKFVQTGPELGRETQWTGAKNTAISGFSWNNGCKEASVVQKIVNADSVERH